MIVLDNWSACLADMFRGVAFFDGLTIEADGITEPRWDRVLPLLEEEQVFAARMMRPQFEARPAARVLDVGTGSGVFAIQAAKCNCSVVAIDPSPRALRFARSNAAKNHVTVSDGPPLPGQIQFVLSTVEDFSRRTNERFDVVLLSPPYNPTHPELSKAVALHANAGLLGQDCFEAQLRQAAQLVSVDGVCIGNQMLLVGSDGRLAAESLLTELFPVGSLEWLRIIPQDIPVEEFLRRQYRNFLRGDLLLEPTRSSVETYIRSHSPGLLFALAYYELRPRTNIAASSRFEVHEQPSAPALKVGWAPRIELHRRIVEHTAREESFPAPALFLDRDALPPFPGRSLASATGAASVNQHWPTSPLRYLDAWVAKEELLSRDRGVLDLLLVDTAPWYPTTDGLRALHQESIVWVAPRNDSKATADALLRAYQGNTLTLQRAEAGPFLHPEFTGQNGPDRWRSVQFTTHEGAADIASAPAAVQRLVSDLADLFAVVDDPPGKFFVPPHNLTAGADVCYASSDLLTLAVNPEELASYWATLKARVRLAADPSTPPRATTSDARQLSRIDRELCAADLDLCHQAMHWRLDQLLRGNPGATTPQSFLIGLPVSVAGSSAVAPSPDHLPRTYRGGIWVYAVARGGWSTELERQLLDISRILCMLYENLYTEQASSELRLVGEREATATIFHQIPKDFGAIEAALRTLGEKAADPGASVELLRKYIPNLDTISFMIMTADAAVQKTDYLLLPQDLPSALAKGLTHGLLQSIFDRLVLPYVRQRIRLSNDHSASLLLATWDDLDEAQRAARFPPPVIEPFVSTRVRDGRDLYIWLVLALRSAAYHSFLPTIQGATTEPGRIALLYSAQLRTLTITNTGFPDDNAPNLPEEGWRRDRKTFSRAHQKWRLLETDGRISSWSNAERLWVTTIWNGS